MERGRVGSDDIISLASDGCHGAALGGGAGLSVPAHTERRLRSAEVTLRFAACVFALLAAVVLGVARETHDFYGLFTQEARYTEMASFVILVNTNGVAAAYNLLQGGRCLATTVRGRALASKPMAGAVFFCDQVMAYVALAALAAAMVSGMIGKFGLAQFAWMATAVYFPKFSMQSAGAIFCAFVAVVAMVAVSDLSAFNLFRLLGAGKGRNISFGQ